MKPTNDWWSVLENTLESCNLLSASFPSRPCPQSALERCVHDIPREHLFDHAQHDVQCMPSALGCTLHVDMLANELPFPRWLFGCTRRVCLHVRNADGDFAFVHQNFEDEWMEMRIRFVGLTRDVALRQEENTFKVSKEPQPKLAKRDVLLQLCAQRLLLHCGQADAVR